MWWSNSVRNDLNQTRFADAEAAIRAKLEHDRDGTTKTLLASLRDPQILVRVRAARVLGACQVFTLQTFDALSSVLLTDPQWSVREAAALALGDFGGQSHEVWTLLVRAALHDRERLVQAAAVQGLAKAPAQLGAALAALRQGLDHPRVQNRCRAITAIGRLEADDKAFWGDIGPLLSDSHRKVRRQAILALGERPRMIGRAIPELVRRRFDRDRTVAEAAAETLDLWNSLAPPAWQPWLACIGRDARSTLRRLREAPALLPELSVRFDSCGLRDVTAVDAWMAGIEDNADGQKLLCRLVAKGFELIRQVVDPA